MAVVSETTKDERTERTTVQLRSGLDTHPPPFIFPVYILVTILCGRVIPGEKINCANGTKH